MPKKKPISAELPSDELVLAAIERAECHAMNASGVVLLATVKEHLGLSRSGWSTRQLQPTWERLQAERLIERSRKSSCVVWSLTSRGRTRLDAARRAGTLGTLPESPQHRTWRQAHQAAGERIEGLRNELHRVLGEAASLLDTETPVPSDAWFELNKHLKHACWQLGSATHCLHEWPAPDDAQPDIDTQGPLGRRHTQAWDES